MTNIVLYSCIIVYNDNMNSAVRSQRFARIFRKRQTRKRSKRVSLSFAVFYAINADNRGRSYSSEGVPFSNTIFSLAVVFATRRNRTTVHGRHTCRENIWTRYYNKSYHTFVTVSRHDKLVRTI